MAGLGILAIVVLKGGRDLFGALSTVKLPSVGDISLPNITLPEINFPAFNFPNPFQSSDPAESIRVGNEDDPFFNTEGETAIPATGFNTAISQDAEGNVVTTFEDPATGDIFIPAGEPMGALEEVVRRDTIDNNNFGQVDFGQAEGGFFTGGQINETPIGNLSLSQIVDRFNVSASQAANIQAEAQNNFGNFDFGSNTGSGLGSVSTRPDINSQLDIGNVSNPEFEGLTATQIIENILGGNINNF